MGVDKHNLVEDVSIQERNSDTLYSIHLILVSNSDEMHELWLPVIPEGFFRFTESPEHRFLSISSKNGIWVASCKKPAFFQDVPLEQSCEIPLTDNQLFKIDVEGRTYSLYVEKVFRNQMVFHNYLVGADIEINIGSHPVNDIWYDTPYVSRKHAILRRSAGQWNIQDCGSVHGVFINGAKRSYADLKTGDLVCIMGLRIIIGPNFLSVNNCAGKVKINQQMQQDWHLYHGGHSYYGNENLADSTDTFFNRTPRKRLESPQKTITVEGPPMSMERSQVPLMLRMGGSMIRGGVNALAGNFMTLISSVIFPVLTSKYTDKQRHEYEQLRTTKYKEYLENKRVEIECACKEEQELLNKKYPTIQNVIHIAKEKSGLWERRPMDSDFLHIRLGAGTLPLSAIIDYPARRFELEPDELEESMYRLVETPRYVDDAPIVLPLTDTRVCGLLGNHAQVIEYIRKLILQIAILHSYDEVKLVFFLDSNELTYLENIRYIPHAWDDHRAMRFIATNEADAYKLGEYIKNQISDDEGEGKELQQVLKKRPYYLIFALNKKLFECHEVMKEILQSSEIQGVSIITAYSNLPKESQSIIELKPSKRNVYLTLGVDGGEDVHFRADDCDEHEFAEAMHILANTRLKTEAQAQELPKMLTFLEMFNAGRIEQLNPLKRWQENNPVKSLATPVGVGADGSLFMLDLHEKRQGPHGLVAGMTGSGKSEFIITYILSLAVNYHPDEVSFVLIDYKGGGLAGAFENPQTDMRLPHLVGTITNLDGASIQRSLMAIESELIRRQKKFAEIKSVVNEGTMDIYAYQKLYRAGKVSEPMPHLFIISDEFAELKQQQPEFMDKLISAARIGRSLGVHLILATQKPSGVVNDQIRSNTKFRVCLRVQERSDSMDMLKRPEAAELTDTGRFYLQVGYNEYFALGQSAWCGAPYVPQDTISARPDETIEFVDTTGQIFAKAKPQAKKADSNLKQIVAIVQYLSDLAKKHGVQSQQLWNEPLKKKLDITEVSSKVANDSESGICAAVGLIDDPAKQNQYPLVLRFSAIQNLLLSGSSGSGKSTFLSTLLYELCNRYSPENINFYIMDFSGGALRPFQNMPHCGAYMTEENGMDVQRFLCMLKQIMEQRKKMFVKEGVTTYEAYSQINSIPLVFVVIDNYAGISALSNGTVLFSSFHEYLKEAASLGIKFLITCTNLNEVSIRCKQELDYRIALQMKDKYAYAEALGRRVAVLPNTCCGRGVCLCEERVLEYQTAIPFCKENEQMRTVLLTQQAKLLSEKFKSHRCAEPLPTVDFEQTYEDFCADISRGRIPLGYDLQSARKISVPLAQLYCGAVNFGNPKSASSVLHNFVYAAQHCNMDLVIVRRTFDSVFERISQEPDGGRNLQIMINSADTSAQLCQKLLQEITQRKSVRNDFLTQNSIPLSEAQNPKVMKKCAPYIRQKTTPLLILFEDFYEFSTCMQEDLFKIYKEIFEGGKGYNFYFMAGFYPETKNKAAMDLLSKAYSANAFVLLFGGQYENQFLAQVPVAIRKTAEQRNAYNDFYMLYNNEFYPLVMPCGIPCDMEEDPDELPII